MSTKLLLICALVVGMLFGIAFEPDAGTQSSIGPPDISGAVLGPNHAKPLPDVPSVAERLGLLGIGIATFVALVASAAVAGARPMATTGSEDGRDRSVYRSPVRARRGPPPSA